MTTTPTPQPHKLIGTRRGWWFVVAHAGRRDGVNLLHCICCRHGVERLIPEPKLLDRKRNSLDHPCRCKGWVGRLTDRVFGLWTVTGAFTPATGQDGRRWLCRCACGTRGVFSHESLLSARELSCGCRPHAEVFKDVDASRWRAADRLVKYGRSGRGRMDREWTAAMERALRAFQPRCVLCGAPHDLTNHHVHPAYHGGTLHPGNAVRLCRSCNSSINIRDVGELSPKTAGRLMDAAESFRAYWEGGCVGAEVYAGTPADDAPTAPDPALVAILRAVEHGDDAGVPSLAGWLGERGDPRAAAVRDAVGLDAELLIAPPTGGVEASYGVRFTRSGKPCASDWWMPTTVPGGPPQKPPAERVRDMLTHKRRQEVYERLGLSTAQADALKNYLGLGSDATPATVEEMARHAGVQPQTIRNRIDLALHNLGDPGTALRLAEQQKRYRESITAVPVHGPNTSGRRR